MLVGEKGIEEMGCACVKQEKEAVPWMFWEADNGGMEISLEFPHPTSTGWYLQLRAIFSLGDFTLPSI